MKQKPFRVPNKLSDQMDKDAKERNFASINEWGIEAFEHFLKCKKLDTTGAMKQIVLKYKDQCLKCTREVEAGEWALWGRGVGVICIDCYVERMGDKTLLAKFLKGRELDRINKVLKRENERLASKFDTLSIVDRLETLEKHSAESHSKLMKYFNEGLGTDEERKQIEECIRTHRKQFQVLSDIEQVVLSKFKVEKRKKKEQVRQ